MVVPRKPVQIIVELLQVYGNGSASATGEVHGCCLRHAAAQALDMRDIHRTAEGPPTSGVIGM
jgi:2-methylcitrate dehydratase PrpD